MANEQRGIERAYLVASLPRMTVQRTQDEWERSRDILRPKVRERLRLIAFCSDGATAPADDETRHLMELLEGGSTPERGRWPAPHSAPSPKFFDVWKVLLGASLG